VPRLYEFYSGICLTSEEKTRKNLSQRKKNLSQVKKNLSQNTVCILPKTPTHDDDDDLHAFLPVPNSLTLKLVSGRMHDVQNE
jgi:hypothetical protein